MGRKLGSCHQWCNESGVSKFIYLSSATLFVSTFMIECILLALVVSPYLTENDFQPSICTYIGSSEINTQKPVACENKCSKSSSHFPCIWVNVTYTNLKQKLTWGYAFDYYSTYNSFSDKKCVASPCEQRLEENRDYIIKFNESLHLAKTMPCFYREISPNSSDVLLWKLHPFSLMLHSILWPCILMVLSIVSIVITFIVAGCDAWSMDKTVIA
jgi:hypothetical protein